MIYEIDEESVSPVYPYWYNHVWACETLGYRWMSFVGRPTTSHPSYPQEQRVRQLFSPSQLASQGWKEFLEHADGREAEGTEPLSYAYCSSGCNVASVPDLINAELAVALSKCVHDLCDDVPHDIGLKLAAIVRKHFVNAVNC